MCLFGDWLHDCHNVYDAIDHARKECKDFSPESPINNFRLKGQGDLTQIRLKYVYSN